MSRPKGVRYPTYTSDNKDVDVDELDQQLVRSSRRRRAQRPARFRSNSSEDTRPNRPASIIGLHNEDNMADNRHSPVIASRSRSPDRVRNEGARDSDRARSLQRRSYDRRHHITPRPSASRWMFSWIYNKTTQYQKL